MTDRKLLEKAAKAAGLLTDGWHRDGGIAAWHPSQERKHWFNWNPLTDDGDALRLAVKMNITTGFDALPDGAIVYTSAEWHDEWDQGFRIMEWLNKDSAAATRRAIVRAAAAMADEKVHA